MMFMQASARKQQPHHKRKREEEDQQTTNEYLYDTGSRALQYGPDRIHGEHIFARERRYYDDDYHDLRFQELNTGRAIDLLRLYERDSDIQTFSRASMNHALAGGILFVRKNKQLSQQARDWHNQVWSLWVREVEKMIFCLGFCIATFFPHPVYGFEPSIVSLEHVEVKYHIDVNNRYEFRVYEKMDAVDMMEEAQSNVVFARRRMRNVRVWSTAPPTNTGIFRSQLTTLLSDLVYETHLLQTSFIADQARARPAIVSQQLPSVYKATTTANNPTSVPGAPMGSSHYLGDGNTPYDPTPINQRKTAGSDLVQIMNAFDSDNLASITARVDRMLNTKVNNASVEQVYLENGRQLVQQILPEPPHDILLGFRQSRAVRVGLMFGLTLPALAAAPTGKHVNEAKKSGNRGGDDDGSNSVYFENFQRELKQRLVVYIHQMYMFMHTAAFAIEALQENESPEPMDQSKLKESVDVDVSLPGQPDENLLHQLFQSGILKYEAYVNYMSSKHSIPMDAFEAKPKLTIQELNGSFEKPEPIGGAKK
jgi:hypothetical protein